MMEGGVEKELVIWSFGNRRVGDRCKENLGSAQEQSTVPIIFVLLRWASLVLGLSSWSRTRIVWFP